MNNKTLWQLVTEFAALGGMDGDSEAAYAAHEALATALDSLPSGRYELAHAAVAKHIPNFNY